MKDNNKEIQEINKIYASINKNHYFFNGGDTNKKMKENEKEIRLKSLSPII